MRNGAPGGGPRMPVSGNLWIWDGQGGRPEPQRSVGVSAAKTSRGRGLERGDGRLRTIVTRFRMEFKEAVKLALQSLWQNKLRTVLTLLGVMIGVSSVIAVVTLVNGANTFVTDQVHALWRGCVYDLAVSGADHQLGGLREISEAQERPVRRLRVCARQLQALRGHGSACRRRWPR